MDKNSKIQEMFKMAEMLNRKKEPDKIPVQEVIDVVEESSYLPSEYITGEGIMVSSKGIMSNTNYLSKLAIGNDAYKDLKFTPEEAQRIQRGMTRLTAGVSSMVALTCLGPNCTFARTCIAQGSEVLTVGDLKGSKAIEKLLPGDTIYSFNTKTLEVEHDTVIALTFMGYKKVYKIITHTGLELRLTEDHPVLTRYKDKVKFMSILEGLGEGSEVYISDTDGITDDLIDSYGDLLVDFIEDIYEDGKDEVYDITVKNNQNFFVSNILVHNCPLQQENKAPIGKDCLVETNLMSYWMEKYMQQFDIDENCLTDLHMVAKLCEYDIYEMRVTKYLKENDQNLLTDFISSYDEQGNPISNKAVSAAFETKERIDRLRSKTLKELMATREARAKLVDTVANIQSSNTIAAMKDKLDELIRQKGKLVGSNV